MKRHLINSSIYGKKLLNKDKDSLILAPDEEPELCFNVNMSLNED